MIGQDLRYALRSVRSNPGFAALAVLSLGLGIGANTAIFTLIDQVLLRLLPVAKPQQLVALLGPGPRSGFSLGGPATFSYPMYRDLRDGNQSMSGMLARFATSVSFAYKGQTERVPAELVSGNYFDVLGVQPAIGRTLAPEDDVKPGAHPVIVLSYAFWQQRFGGSPAILNQTVTINGNPMTIVGVAAPEFGGVEVGRPSAVFLPMAMKKQATPTWDELQNRQAVWVNVIGRLKPGVTQEQAAANLNVIYSAVLKQEVELLKDAPLSYRQRFLQRKVQVAPADRGRSGLRDRFSTPLIVLMSMVGLVLLIACANVASLLTARATARQKEIAIRLALGARRGRVVRQLIVEGLCLALCGGALGLIVAAWTGDALLRFLPFEGPIQQFRTMPDVRVMAFTMALAVVTGILFSLAPALQATRPNVAPALKDQTNAVASGGGQVRFRKGLVIAQFALCLLLLVGTGLFARSLYNLQSLNPGIDTGKLVTFAADPALNGYGQPRVIELMDRALDRLAAIPGVESVSFTKFPVLANARPQLTIMVEGYRAKEGEDMNPQFNVIAPGYFATMGIPLISGRDFRSSDGPGAPKGVIINESTAKYFFKNENPIGRRIGLDGGNAPMTHEVIGVVKDDRGASLREESGRWIFMHYKQWESHDRINFYLRTAQPDSAILPAVRRAMHEADPNLPLFSLKSMTAQINELLFIDRLIAVLAAGFGFLATLLAAIGLYGITAYGVARRTREIGIRVALGAKTLDVIGLVMREVALMTAIGIVLGIPIALGLSRSIQSQLYGLEAKDPATLAAASVLLAVIAFTAGFIPARRAARIEPLRALHHE